MRPASVTTCALLGRGLPHAAGLIRASRLTLTQRYAFATTDASLLVLLCRYSKHAADGSPKQCSAQPVADCQRERLRLLALAGAARGKHYAATCRETCPVRLFPSVLHWVVALLLLGLCVTVSPALATRAPVMPVPNQVTVADGLPSDVIGELAEDKQGYLWLASDDGLARFDGRNYRIWRMEEGLTGNAIWTICVDQDNRVWMGFENGGAGFLEAKTRTFKPLENAQFPELRQITVWSLAQTPNGDIWLGTAANGLYRRRPDGSMQQFLNVPGDSASLPADAVNALRVAPNGTLWIATPGGLVRWDGKKFTRVALPGSSQTVCPNRKILA